MVISFQEIVSQISGVCLSHRQVNQFGYGDFLKYVKGNQLNYPLTFLTDGKSNIVGTSLNLNFIFIVCDKLISDGSNELKVLSNCLEIGLDVIGRLQYTGYTATQNLYQLNFEDIQMTPFIDSFPDVLGGWRFEIKIITPERYDSCNAPFNNDII